MSDGTMKARGASPTSANGASTDRLEEIVARGVNEWNDRPGLSLTDPMTPVRDVDEMLARCKVLGISALRYPFTHSEVTALITAAEARGREKGLEEGAERLRARLHALASANCQGRCVTLPSEVDREFAALFPSPGPTTAPGASGKGAK